MSLILNIDSSSAIAFVSIAKNGVALASITNPDQKDHAGFIQTGIQQLIKKTGIELNQLDAIAVNAGPGSYTGLRVGMASAKGLCYALGKPFITINSLLILAASCLEQVSRDPQYEDHFLCPMIDARRMEVYTALYDQDLKILSEPQAMILDENSFHEQLSKKRILFFGNGATKWKDLVKDPNAHFCSISEYSVAMNRLSHEACNKDQFTELVDSQPIYLKEFHFGK